MSSGKKSIYFVIAVLTKSATTSGLATTSGAPENKYLHIQLRATQPLRAAVTAPQRPGNPVWQSHCVSPAFEMAPPCCWSSLRALGQNQGGAEMGSAAEGPLANPCWWRIANPCLLRENWAPQADEEPLDQHSQLLLFSLSATHNRCLLIMQINTNAVKQRVFCWTSTKHTIP